MKNLKSKFESVQKKYDYYVDEDLNDLYENAPCGYLSISLDGTIIRANKTFCIFVDEERESVDKQRSFQEYLSYSSKILFYNTIMPSLLLGHETKDLHIELTSMMGFTVPVLINAIQIRDHLGELKFIRMSLINLSEQRKVEKLLDLATKEAEEWFSRLKLAAEFGFKASNSLDYSKTLSNITEMICANIADGCLIDVIYDESVVRVSATHKEENQITSMMNMPTGFIVNEVVRTSKSLIVNDLDTCCIDPAFYHHMEDLKSLGIQSFVVMPLITAGSIIGTISFISNDVYKYYGPEDLVLMEGLSCHVSSSIHKSKVYEKNLSDTKLRSDLINMASDEIRTSLVTLKSQLLSSLKKISLSEVTHIKRSEVERVLTKLNLYIENISLKVDKMFDLNEISQSLSLFKEQVNFTDLVEQYFGIFEPSFMYAGSQVSLVAEKGLLLFMDKERIEKVVALFLNNALEFGKGHPVEVKLSKHEDYIAFSVVDLGPSIDVNHQTHIFQRTKSDLSTTELEGLQLELRLSRIIVEEHGGFMRIETDLGANHFTVFLPT